MPAEPKPLILVVEDEKDLAEMVSEQLEALGMDTQACFTAAHAFNFLKGSFANLMLLDVNLPDKSGFALLEELRAADLGVPVIFLTGNDSEVQKVRGLDLGGDDYVTKPFSFPELAARIRAVLRRAETAQDQRVVKNASVALGPFAFGGATVDPARLEVSFPGGGLYDLGRKELGILAHLAAHEGSVVTRKSLIHAVWGVHADVRSRSLDQYIVKLRNAFGKADCPLDEFRTVHGVGYIYDPGGKAQQ